MIPNYFVIIWDNQPVGLDQASGGCPYKTDWPGSIKYWKTREAAQKYMDISQSENNNWKVVEIQFRIVG